MSHNQFEKTEHKSIVKELFEKGFIKKLQSLLCIMTLCLMIMTSAILVPLAVPVGQAKTASVFDYKITNVVQTKPDTIVVSVECTFCSACNPNSAGNPGCTPFSLACGFPPSSYPAGSGWPCAAGCPDGRFAAVQIVGSFGIITQKLVCTPANWPISAVHAQDFTFSGLSLKTGESITVYADFYCSWCAHWWAQPKTFVPNLGIGYFIIVAGTYYGGLQTQIDYGCNQVFKILINSCHFTKDRIYYLNPSFQDIDGDSVDDRSGWSSSANVQYAITTWASTRASPTQPLFLYLFDHGGMDIFCIENGTGYFSVAQNDLGSWLNTLETSTKAPIHTIYAACHSGSFIDDLSKTGRIIATSCRPLESSYLDPTGKWEAFSVPFWNEIKSGHSIAWSFNIACYTIGNTLPQTPLLDDNGDAVGHAGPLPSLGDGLLAGNVYIGLCEWPFPWIRQVIRKQFFAWPPSTTVPLWAKVENNTPLTHVIAWMIPPDWSPPPPSNYSLQDPGFQSFEMADNDHDGNWTVNVSASNFTSHASGPSDFKFIITAEEQDGETAISLLTGVGFTETGQPPIDIVQPAVRIERPLEGRFVQGTITINGTTADDVCLQKVEVYVGGSLAGTVNMTPVSNSFFEVSFDTTSVSNGFTDILVKAFDTSDNNGVQTYAVKIDNSYDVTINAHCNTEHETQAVDIMKNWNASGYQTSHTFTLLRGTNAFTVPSVDPNGHEFKRWNTGETNTTILVSSGGTYTAYYGESPGVGGFVIPVDKLGLLAPYIGLASTAMIGAVATAVYVKRVKRRKEKQ